MAQGVKRAYEPLFASNENAHTLSGEELRGLVAQVTGAEEEITKRTAATFKALVELSDQNALAGTHPPSQQQAKNKGREDVGDSGDESKHHEVTDPPVGREVVLPIRPEFHYNIQVHLPSNGTEETYLNIFNALRKALS
jgi:hypothetical protein